MSLRQRQEVQEVLRSGRVVKLDGDDCPGTPRLSHCPFTGALGDISRFTGPCEKTRLESFELMLRHANAIIGIRYDAPEVMGGVTEVLASGTASVVEPEIVEPEFQG